MPDELASIDLLKCSLSLVAGVLLGMERELKDKAAGVKTISIICLGATLFSIISLRYDPDRATTLAAYIVSGVGFLGAGVIFKDSVSISGLTTASIIWMAAAIGTSIGFGEFYLAAASLLGSFIIIWLTPLLSKLVATKKQGRILTLYFTKDEFDDHADIIKLIRQHARKMTREKIKRDGERIELIFDLVVDESQIAWLDNFLMTNPRVSGFIL
jgi:putative Mg2+ transporter-C (MgtC) family protein